MPLEFTFNTRAKYKTQLYFCKLTINTLKIKLRKLYLQYYKKCLEINLPKKCKTHTLKITKYSWKKLEKI